MGPEANTNEVTGPYSHEMDSKICNIDLIGSKQLMELNFASPEHSRCSPKLPFRVERLNLHNGSKLTLKPCFTKKSLGIVSKFCDIKSDKSKVHIDMEVASLDKSPTKYNLHSLSVEDFNFTDSTFKMKSITDKALVAIIPQIRNIKSSKSKILIDLNPILKFDDFYSNYDEDLGHPLKVEYLFLDNKSTFVLKSNLTKNQPGYISEIMILQNGKFYLDLNAISIDHLQTNYVENSLELPLKMEHLFLLNSTFVVESTSTNQFVEIVPRVDDIYAISSNFNIILNKTQSSHSSTKHNFNSSTQLPLHLERIILLDSNFYFVSTKINPSQNIFPVIEHINLGRTVVYIELNANLPNFVIKNSTKPKFSSFKLQHLDLVDSTLCIKLNFHLKSEEQAQFLLDRNYEFLFEDLDCDNSKIECHLKFNYPDFLYNSLVKFKTLLQVKEVRVRMTKSEFNCIFNPQEGMQYTLPKIISPNVSNSLEHTRPAITNGIKSIDSDLTISGPVQMSNQTKCRNFLNFSNINMLNVNLGPNEAYKTLIVCLIGYGIVRIFSK